MAPTFSYPFILINLVYFLKAAILALSWYHVHVPKFDASIASFWLIHSSIIYWLPDVVDESP